MPTNIEIAATPIHRFIEIDGPSMFYREAGPRDAPVLLLPHGHPCSSFQFRRLMPALADRWQKIAFDWPGFGYSDTPDPSAFGYDFDGLCRCPDAVCRCPRPKAIRAVAARLRLADRPAARDRASGPDRRARPGEVADDIAERVAPDLWKLHWPLMNTPVRRQISVGLMEKLEANLALFPRYQAYLRQHRPPTLIVWGPEDGYMPTESARAYHRDLPDAELHLLEGAGHWLLETHFDEAMPLVRDFLCRVHA